MRQPKQTIPREWPSWMTLEQRTHLINRRYNQMVEDEEIREIIDLRIDNETKELKLIIKDLKQQIKELQSTNQRLETIVDLYEKSKGIK